MGWNLFLDDERDPPHDGRKWTIARSCHEAMVLVEKYGLPDYASLDHDLGDGGTGAEFVRKMGDYVLDHHLSMNEFEYYVHSQNPVGADNIRGYLKGLTTAVMAAEWTRTAP